MVLPPPVDDSAVTAFAAPRSNACRHEHAVSVQDVFHPEEVTQT